MSRRERLDSQIKEAEQLQETRLTFVLERQSLSEFRANSLLPRLKGWEGERDIWGDTNIGFYSTPVGGARGQKINKIK